MSYPALLGRFAKLKIQRFAAPGAYLATSQGDDLCKGCGRTFDEVQHWPAMGPTAKRQVWRRITLEHTAWRFTRYAERAAEGGSKPPAV